MRIELHAADAATRALLLADAAATSRYGDHCRGAGNDGVNNPPTITIVGPESNDVDDGSGCNGDRGNAAALPFNSSGFNRLTAVRARRILRHLRAGVDVLYSDVDVALLRDPFTAIPLLRAAVAAAASAAAAGASSSPDLSWDIAVAVDEQPRGGDARARADAFPALSAALRSPVLPVVCTGFMYVRSTPRSIDLMRRWWDATRTGEEQDQTAFNRLLHAHVHAAPSASSSSSVAALSGVASSVAALSGVALPGVALPEVASRDRVGEPEKPEKRQPSNANSITDPNTDSNTDPNTDTKVRVRYLAEDVVVNGYTFFEQWWAQSDRMATVTAVLNNHIKGLEEKIRRFRDQGLWLLEGEGAGEGQRGVMGDG